MGINPENLLKEYFGKSAKTIRQLAGEVDTNYYIETNDGEKFNLKIARIDELHENLDMQNRLIAHLKEKSAPFVYPEAVPNLKGNLITTFIDAQDRTRYVRLLKWIPGRLWSEVNPHTSALLYELGQLIGTISKYLSDFDHHAAYRFIKWDPSQLLWINEHIHHITDNANNRLVHKIVEQFEELAKPILEQCRKNVNFNDSSDNNILVSMNLASPEVIGVIDFGDMVFSHSVNELAIAIAYGVMNLTDPLSAALEITRGYANIYPLRQEELAVLYHMVSARLAISVTCSAINAKEHPENPYLQISEQPALELLKKWCAIHPDFAHYAFRGACGFEPCPTNHRYREWLAGHEKEIGTSVHAELSQAVVLDASIGSSELGLNENFSTPDAFDKWVTRTLHDHGVSTGIGRYNEARALYTTEQFRVVGNNGAEWRTVHIGLDIFQAPGSPICAPLDGTVISAFDNAQELDYGPTIILEHAVEPGLTFFTLYGHLSRDCLTRVHAGMKVTKHQQFATMGARPENGNWPPHVHFQIILNLFEQTHDFPGVARFDQKALWNSICPDPCAFLGLSSASLMVQELAPEEIIHVREELLGKNLSISYKNHLKMVRGYMQYLYDYTGRRYLDTVNNVPHVGHQHPRVVKAAHRQMAVLNTNTRYLHEQIIRYAEELCATLPKELCVCYFVNSGSEANELALRIAHTCTNQRDMVVVEVGYHGNTTGCIEISDYKFSGAGGKGPSPHIHVVPLPDTYRGLYRASDPQASQKYALHIREAIQTVQQQGRGIAGFICESLLSCGGQIVLPENYLKKAFEHVHEAGGLCIMDEVQVGFGRVGTQFWGFELQGIVPDIVTLGKPIGNGHPLGAVITTRAVADAFANGMEFFSTFGGNPVSCAIGREVLKVIKDERLQAHALDVGSYLISMLKELQRSYSIIGDVRGSGLFIGIELVTNPVNPQPATQQAYYLINRMREQGVLMSTEGRQYNVLKIKPPMPFNRDNADTLIDLLNNTLREDFLSRNRS